MKISLKKFAAVLMAIAAAAAAGCSKEETPSANTASDGAADTAVQAGQDSSARVSVTDGKFTVAGRELWLNGVNTPWYNWNDFNGNMDTAAWEDTFALLESDSINCTRIWVNCAGMNTVRLKSTGEIKEVNEKHWEDLDKLFALAEKYHVYVIPTLLSFDHFKDSNGGGTSWQELIKNKDFCDSYAEKYAAEFAKKYADCEYILGVDIMNEPDWVHENDECGKIGWDNLSYLFGKCAAAIHENSDMLVTVGLGIVKYNSEDYEKDVISDEYLKKLTGDDKAYVDFYSTHYYDWERPWFGYPFDKSPDKFGLHTDKPCILGETSNDGTDMTLTEKYKNCHDNGWCGVLVWMESRHDGTSGCDEIWYRYDLTEEAVNAMAEYIPDKIYPIGRAEIPAAA